MIVLLEQYDLGLHCLHNYVIMFGVKIAEIIPKLSPYLVLCSCHEKRQKFNPCHAEEIKMACPFLIIIQLDYLIQIVDIDSLTE